MRNTILLFGILFITLNACKDKCKDVLCLNNGTCVDGTCECPDGYKGEHCETKIDLCKGVTCYNDGVCEDGTCNCPIGYVGENCESTFATKFLGTFDVICNGSLDIDGNNKDFVNEKATAKIYQGKKYDDIIIYTELEMITNNIPMVVDANARVDGDEYDLEAKAIVISVDVAGVPINLNFLVDGTGVLEGDSVLTSDIVFTGDLSGTIHCVGTKQK